MNRGERVMEQMNYLNVAKAVLGTSAATKATFATEGVLEELWRAGGWLVIAAREVRAVRVPAELEVWVRRHPAEVLRALHRRQVAASIRLGGAFRSQHEDTTWRSADENAEREGHE